MSNVLLPAMSVASASCLLCPGYVPVDATAVFNGFSWMFG